jgi:hypothetical protein
MNLMGFKALQTVHYVNVRDHLLEYWKAFEELIISCFLYGKAGL